MEKSVPGSELGSGGGGKLSVQQPEGGAAGRGRECERDDVVQVQRELQELLREQGGVLR